MPAEGSYQTGPLDTAGSYNYTLKCVSDERVGGRPIQETIALTVSPAVEPSLPPEPQPTLSFTAADGSVASGDSTTLGWAATNADSCTASGAWSGSKSTSGSQSVGPLSADATFALSCSGPGGSTSSSVTVTVSATPPTVSLAAGSSSIDHGSSTTLSWSAQNATSCSASGGWSGSRSLSGTETVAPTSDTTYALSCTGEGGSDSASVTVTVNTPAPTLSLTAADTSVASGGATTLSWTATHADSCTASGGWSGTKGASGSESVGPISASTTYTLACTGPGGSVLEMLSISAIDEVSIAWQAPTQNVDGTTLTNLAGYLIYYGDFSGNYTGTVEINDPTATSHDLSLASGTYFITMTAIDAEGNESGYSNEVSKTVP